MVCMVVLQGKNFLQKEHCFHVWFAQYHADNPESAWKNVLWKDETKIELFALNKMCFLYFSDLLAMTKYCIPT